MDPKTLFLLVRAPILLGPDATGIETGSRRNTAAATVDEVVCMLFNLDTEGALLYPFFGGSVVESGCVLRIRQEQRPLPCGF